MVTALGHVARFYGAIGRDVMKWAEPAKVVNTAAAAAALFKVRSTSLLL